MEWRQATDFRRLRSAPRKPKLYIMGRPRSRFSIALIFAIVSSAPPTALARGEDSVAQFYCARGFAHLAGPIEKLFLPRTARANDYAGWKTLIMAQIANPNAGAGAAFKVSATDAPQAVETVKWMIGSLNGRTLTKPWQFTKTQRLKLRLQEFETSIQKTGEIPWAKYLELSTDFSETMGRRAPLENYNTYTNNLALGREYIDKAISKAVARQPYTMVMPTHRPMSIAELNELSPYPIFPAELVAYRQKADRELYYPLSYFGHDLSHGSIAARAFEKQIKRLEAGEITNAEYAKYVEDRIQLRAGFSAMAAKQTPEIQNALELLWFNFTHEGLDHVGHTLVGEMNIAELQQVAGLRTGNESTLVSRSIYSLKYRDIFETSVKKPTEGDLREAMTVFERYANSLPVSN
jgi:hypothetical protein